MQIHTSFLNPYNGDDHSQFQLQNSSSRPLYLQAHGYQLNHHFLTVNALPADVVVAPTAVHIPLVQSSLRKDFHIAAQNAWVKGCGAYTGEIRYAPGSPASSILLHAIEHAEALAGTSATSPFGKVLPAVCAAV